MGRICTAIIVIAALVPLASCRPVDKLGFTPVDGRVTLDGKPLEAGEIRFQPDGSRGNKGPMSSAMLGPDGRFSLRGPGGRGGAIPGAHRVYLVSPFGVGVPEPELEVEGKPVARDEVDGEPPRAQPSSWRVPRKYLTADTSDLAAAVTGGKPNAIDFDLVTQRLGKSP